MRKGVAQRAGQAQVPRQADPVTQEHIAGMVADRQRHAVDRGIARDPRGAAIKIVPRHRHRPIVHQIGQPGVLRMADPCAFKARAQVDVVVEPEQPPIDVDQRIAPENPLPRRRLRQRGVYRAGIVVDRQPTRISPEIRRRRGSRQKQVGPVQVQRGPARRRIAAIQHAAAAIVQAGVAVGRAETGAAVIHIPADPHRGREPLVRLQIDDHLAVGGAIGPGIGHLRRRQHRQRQCLRPVQHRIGPADPQFHAGIAAMPAQLAKNLPDVGIGIPAIAVLPVVISGHEPVDRRASRHGAGQRAAGLGLHGAAVERAALGRHDEAAVVGSVPGVDHQRAAQRVQAEQRV